jgi:energy-converting hydrogenase A subunit R
MTKIICFDLEGPLSPQDNAYEVMGLVEGGHRIFEVLSRYDDVLTLEKREGYEPGDTLSLIVPFLLHHGIKEEDIKRVSSSAKIVDGVKETIDALKKTGWDPHIISTSYEPHALSIASKIGIPRHKVHCTKLPLEKMRKDAGDSASSLVEGVEKDILNDLYPNLSDDSKIKARLDCFFGEDLAKTPMGKVMKEVSVVGGQRKMDAVSRIAKKAERGIEEAVVVGDSITDYKMLGTVRDAGGVAVAFNGNRYSIPYANVGLACTDMRMLLVIIEGYECGQTRGAISVVKEWEEHDEEFLKDPHGIHEDTAPDIVRRLLADKQADKGFMRPYFHVLQGIDEKKREEIMAIHKKARSLVRGDAAKLG